MAFKQFKIDDETVVTIYKRKSSRNLRLSITPKGDVKVSIPSWASYSSGLLFARSKRNWINAKKQPLNILQQGHIIGKAHHINFISDPSVSKPAGRIRLSEIIVKYPQHLHHSDPTVQKAAESASLRALRLQAESLLPQRLQLLAKKHGFEYKSISIKLLKSRWGSCDQNKNIVLNLYLMQLPWPNIDYVILHELVHTVVLKHGPRFWVEFERVLPDARRFQKQMKAYQPALHGSA